MTTAAGVKLLLKQARALREHLATYVSAKTDSAQLRLRNAALWMALVAMGSATLVGLLVTAGWFVLHGVAGGLGVLFGDRLWVGNVVTGVLAWAGLGLGTYCVVARRMMLSRKATIQKYEERRTRRQEKLGHNVGDQAVETTTDDQ